MHANPTPAPEGLGGDLDQWLIGGDGKFPVGMHGLEGLSGPDSDAPLHSFWGENIDFLINPISEVSEGHAGDQGLWVFEMGCRLLVLFCSSEVNG